MTEIITFSTDQVAPEREDVLRHQGIPPGKFLHKEIETLCDNAFGLLSETGAPIGIMAEISRDDFAAVYRGEGRNEGNTPVEDIFPRADRLALFAATLGERISREIGRRFASNDLALGCMLDSVASTAADIMVRITEERLSKNFGGQSNADTKVLAYSPGYCGWHMSGQRKLFDFLHPEQVGISLGDSFLMQPLKSVSGVMIAGHKEIHVFEDSYPSCTRCETRDCRERIRRVLGD
jgi:hypothetical protein